MKGKVVSSEGWVHLNDHSYSKSFNQDSPANYLKIMWTSDSFENGNIHINFNNDVKAIIPELVESKNQIYCLELRDIPIYCFKVFFSPNNTNRNINFYGFY